MAKPWSYETQKALETGKMMQQCYFRLLRKAPNSEIESLVADMLRMEKINELLLKRVQNII